MAVFFRFRCIKKPPTFADDFLEIVFAIELPEQTENGSRTLICLREHCLCCLRKDVVFGVVSHFLSHIGIADYGFGLLVVVSSLPL